MSGETHFVGPIDRVLYLKTFEPLSGIGYEELALIARLAIERTFRKGEHLLEEGQPVRRFYIVISGRVRVQSGGQLLMVCQGRDNVGILHAFAGASEGVEALADIDTLTLEFDFERLTDLCEEHFSILQAVIRNMARFGRLLVEETCNDTFRAPWPADVHVPDRKLDVVERLILLRRGQVFRNAGIETLALLSTGMIQERWPPGHQLWMVGDRGDHLLLILEGTVQCVLADSARRFRGGPGFPLGNIETMARHPRWYTATTETALVTLRGNHEALFDILEDHFDVALELLGAMAQGALNAVQWLAERGQVTGWPSAAGSGKRRERHLDFGDVR